MKRQLRRAENPRTGFMDKRYLSRVVDTAFPAMSQFFDMARLDDPGYYRAIATLEYLAGHFADRIRL
jgi:hypothetical protein